MNINLLHYHMFVSYGSLPFKSLIYCDYLYIFNVMVYKEIIRFLLYNYKEEEI